MKEVSCCEGGGVLRSSSLASEEESEEEGTSFFHSFLFLGGGSASVLLLVCLDRTGRSTALSFPLSAPFSFAFSAPRFSTLRCGGWALLSFSTRSLVPLSFSFSSFSSLPTASLFSRLLVFSLWGGGAAAFSSFSRGGGRGGWEATLRWGWRLGGATRGSMLAKEPTTCTLYPKLLFNRLGRCIVKVG